MAIYRNSNSESVFASVETKPLATGNLTFLYLNTTGRIKSDPAKGDTGAQLIAQFPEAKEAVTKAKQALKDYGLNQTIVAESIVDGKPVLVTQGPLHGNDLVKTMREKGEDITLHQEQKPFNVWALRGGMSIVGQTLQLTSSCFQTKDVIALEKKHGAEKFLKLVPELDPAHKNFIPRLKEEFEAAKAGIKSGAGNALHIRESFAPDIGVFAILNLLANGVNIAYGGQESPDEHRLKALKSVTSEQLAPHTNHADNLPGNDIDRSQAYRDPPPPLTKTQKVDAFMKANSVRVGEIGLRFLASLALIVPAKKRTIVEGMEFAKEGEYLKAASAVRQKNPVLLGAGLAYVTGKTLGLFTKVHDPHDPKPASMIDKIRENVLFPVDNAIEFGAGSAIAYNAFNHKTVGLAQKGLHEIKPVRDYAGSVGGLIFAGGYLSRYWAKFGTKELNMADLEAHLSDSLAQMPKEKLPQLVADSTAALADHLTDNKVSFGELYAKAAVDLYEHHQVAINTDQPIADKLACSTMVNDGASNSQAKFTQRVTPKKPLAAMIEPKTPDSHIAKLQRKQHLEPAHTL